MKGCIINRDMLINNGNRVIGCTLGEKMEETNITPLDNWIGFGLKVIRKYDNDNDQLLACDGNKNEWVVEYHVIYTFMKKKER